MSEEAAFLAALRDNPADDTTRLVYADWLDDHGDSARAAYLRAVVELTYSDPGTGDYTAAAAALFRAVPNLQYEWLADVGRRFELFLAGYGVMAKIPVIKVIRDRTGLGLAESKALAESAPTPVVSWERFEELFDRQLSFEHAVRHEPNGFVDLVLRPTPWPGTTNDDEVLDIRLTRLVDERDNRYGWGPPFPPTAWVGRFEIGLRELLGRTDLTARNIKLPLTLVAGVAARDVARELRRVQLHLNVYRMVPSDGFQILSRPRE